ncbi:MAG: flavodoxin family protein [Desulfobacterium sp.]
MKTMVVYSSKTGNTKMVAQAIHEILPHPSEIYPVETAPSPDGYDFIVLGFWVDRGTADGKSRDYFKKIKGEKIAVFGTLGAYPDSKHAQKCLEKVRTLTEGNECLGEFICQGKVDPALIEMMATKMKDDPHHAMTPERQARLVEAAKHPDKADLESAQAVFREILKKIED